MPSLAAMGAGGVGGLGQRGRRRGGPPPTQEARGPACGGPSRAMPSPSSLPALASPVSSNGEPRRPSLNSLTSLHRRAPQQGRRGSLGRSPSITQEDALLRARTLFAEADEDGSGELDEEEFATLVKKLAKESSWGWLGRQHSASHLRTLFRRADVDGSGAIDFDEFLVFANKQKARGKWSL